MTNEYNEKINRSYILMSVISKNGSWNSDFDHKPKRYKDTFFASDRVLKHSVRHVFEAMGEPVFIKRWTKYGIPDAKKKTEGKKLVVKNDKEVKEEILNTFGKSIQEAFWEFTDIRQFGMLYDSLGVHGVVQISQGIDKYKHGREYEDDLTSRMNFEKKSSTANGESETTTAMNPRNFLSEAHFLYDVTINPSNIAFFKDIEELKENIYSEEDYEKLIFGLINGPRSVKSTQKLNCFTGFLVQIDLVDDSKLLLADLQSKVNVLVNPQTGEATYDIEPLIEYALTKANHNKDLFENFIVKYDKYVLKIKDLEELVVKYPFIKVEEL